MAAELTLYSPYASWSISLGQLEVITLVGNSNTVGMCRIPIYQKLSGQSIYTYLKDTTFCISNTASQNYIPSLYELTHLTYSSGRYDQAMVRAYHCSSGVDCSCTSYEPTPADETLDSESSNIPIETAIGITPNPITNLTLTPGDRKLYVNWTEPSNSYAVYAYGMSLWKGTTQLASGYKFDFPFEITNLTNGTTYELKVQPVSHDYFFGTTVSKTGVPGASCVDPSCKIQII